MGVCLPIPSASDLILLIYGETFLNNEFQMRQDLEFPSIMEARKCHIVCLRQAKFCHGSCTIVVRGEHCNTCGNLGLKGFSLEALLTPRCNSKFNRESTHLQNFRYSQEKSLQVYSLYFL